MGLTGCSLPKTTSRVKAFAAFMLIMPLGPSCGPAPQQGQAAAPSGSSYEESSSGEPVFVARPDYPDEARRLGLEGQVDVMAKVDEEGRVIDAEIARSTNEIFNAAALEAAYRCRFRIITGGGERVPARVSIPFRFSLRDSG